MNATVTEIQADLAADQASGKILLAKVTALETLTNNIFTQLEALIAANAGAGNVSVSDLNALRDGLVSAKVQADAASASIDTTVAADTVPVVNAPSTDTTTPVAVGTAHTDVVDPPAGSAGSAGVTGETAAAPATTAATQANTGV